MIAVRLSGPLPPFEGPLDLLLALARRNGYPLDRLPVARITEQFLLASRQVKAEDGAADADLLAEWMEVGSWLVLLKSRSLLPQPAEQDAAADELGRVLVDHAGLRPAVRETAALLAARLAESGLSAGLPLGNASGAHGAAGEQVPAAAAVPASPTMHDAVLAARGALAAVQARARAEERERFTVEAALGWAETQLAALAPGQALSTAAWFDQRPEAEARAALLLALLELARLRRALVHQQVPFGPVLIKQVSA